MVLWVDRILGAIPGTISEVTGNSSPEPSYEFANQTEIATLLNPAPAPEQAAGCPLVQCKVRHPRTISPF